MKLTTNGMVIAMLNSVKVSIDHHTQFDSMLINDVAGMLEKLRNDLCVGNQYKKMDIKAFIHWASKGVTPKQFQKLQSLS